MERKINKKGLEKLKLWEGLRLVAYCDESGTLTIGYGHTSAAGYPEVTEGMEISEAEAERILLSDIAIFEKRVRELVQVSLTDNQFSALVSFDFNTGKLHESTLLKKLNDGDYNAVPVELMKWVKTTDPKTGKKFTSKGLVNRRAAEAGLWASGAEMASAVVAAEHARPPVITKETLSWGAGIVASLAALFEGSGPVQWVLSGMIAISFSIGLFLFLFKRLRAA